MKMNATELFKSELSVSGYYHNCETSKEFKRIKKLSRVWKRIIHQTNLRNNSALELGCGGGRHLVSLALNGFTVDGVDVSPEVIERAKTYIKQVEKYVDRELRINVATEDMFDISDISKYDMVYHFGVIEHFLERIDRLKMLKIMVNAVKENGYVVSVVPNGMHLWRKTIKKNNLCGYNIPEIDYSLELHSTEFIEAGLTDIATIPWNYLGFIFGVYPRINRLVLKILYLIVNILMNILPGNKKIKQKFAGTLIVIGKK